MADSGEGSIPSLQMAAFSLCPRSSGDLEREGDREGRRSLVSLPCCLVAQSCLTLCNPTDCSLTGPSVHGIFQARILEWVAIFLKGIFPPQESNLCLLRLLNWKAVSLPLHHLETSSYVDSNPSMRAPPSDLL